MPGPETTQQPMNEYELAAAELNVLLPPNDEEAGIRHNQNLLQYVSGTASEEVQARVKRVESLKDLVNRRYDVPRAAGEIAVRFLG